MLKFIAYNIYVWYVEPSLIGRNLVNYPDVNCASIMLDPRDNSIFSSPMGDGLTPGTPFTGREFQKVLSYSW